MFFHNPIKILLLLLLVAGCGGGIAERLDENKRPCAVELNGDSVLFGFARNEQARLDMPPAKWLEGLGYVVYDNTAGGLSTYRLFRGYQSPDGNPETPLIFYPNGPQPSFFEVKRIAKVVVLQTGINDYRMEYGRGDLTLNGIRQDYEKMIFKIREEGRVPVVAGLINISKTSFLSDHYDLIGRLRTAIRQVAHSEGVLYAGFDEVELNYLSDGIDDGVHVNQDSSVMLANKLHRTLIKACEKN